MSQEKRQFTLIGYPLSHSFSEKYFTQKFEKEGILNHEYSLSPLENIEAFPDLISSMPDLVGLNVTIPYKEQVIPYLDEVSEEAAAIGAVNTIKIENGKLKGYNTDVYGFEKSLTDFLQKENKKEVDISTRGVASAHPDPKGNPVRLPSSAHPDPKGNPARLPSSAHPDPKGNPAHLTKKITVENALVLGTGGAAKAVVFILKKMGIEPILISRRQNGGDLTYSDLDNPIFEECRLIVNTTPLGMLPNLDSFPNLPYHRLNKKYFLYDLVYNPEKTVFLKKGESQNTATKNGLEMLHLQAEKSWEIWNE